MRRAWRKWGVDCISFDDCKDYLRHNRADIILTTGIEQMRNQLKIGGIHYYEYVDEERNYFYQPYIKAQIDDWLLKLYKDTQIADLKCNRCENWFREDYCDGDNNLNKRLVTLMRDGKTEDVNNLLVNRYKDQEKLYEDEMFEHRPAFKLIKTIIEQDGDKSKSICDIGCGNGTFLEELKDSLRCYGVDLSSRIGIKRSGIELISSRAEDIGYEDNKFEYVTCMECLEHVIDPFIVCREAYRILKEKGMLFVTVPYKNFNECTTHVRLFDEYDLYSVLKTTGFKDIRIMKLPYLYRKMGDNLLCSGVK